MLLILAALYLSVHVVYAWMPTYVHSYPHGDQRRTSSIQSYFLETGSVPEPRTCHSCSQAVQPADAVILFLFSTSSSGTSVTGVCDHTQYYMGPGDSNSGDHVPKFSNPLSHLFNPDFGNILLLFL